MRYPFDKYIVGTKFGAKGSLWKCGYHSGVDLLSINHGGDGLVHPISSGVVYKIGRATQNHSSYGNCVYVKHPDGYMSLYAHLKTVYVQPKMMVDENTILGVEGQTGNASGKHLHLEIHKGEYHYPSQIDPLKYIQSKIGGDEVQKTIMLKLNGTVKAVTAIEKDGNNYVKLQDLRDDKIYVGYDNKEKFPVIEVK